MDIASLRSANHNLAPKGTVSRWNTGFRKVSLSVAEEYEVLCTIPVQAKGQLLQAANILGWSAAKPASRKRKGVKYSVLLQRTDSQKF